MHLKKQISRSISLLCVLILLAALTPSAHAALSGTLTNGDILISTVDTEGTDQKSSNNSDMSVEWTASGTTISGTITPGSTDSWGSYYPDKSAKTVLTLQSNSDDESILSFVYTTPGNGGSIAFSENVTLDGNEATATLTKGQSVTVTLTTSSSPSSKFGSDNRTSYTTTTTLSSVSLTSVNADLNITLKSVEGGVFTGSDGNETKGEGESFSQPMDTVYSFTAGTPEANYFFDGWAFNGVKQADTSMTISGISFNSDTVVEALYVMDPVYAITTAKGDIPKGELVEINSRYVHQTRSNLVDGAVSSNNSVPYHSVTATTGTSGDFDTQYVPSQQWTQSGSTVVVSASGTATGEYETGGSRSWAYANMVSDVIRIYAKQDSIISFDYTNSISGGSENVPGIHIYESTSGSETIATVLSKGTTYSETSGTVTHTLAAEKYLYIYTNGYCNDSKIIILGSGNCSMDYSYGATITNVSVELNEIKYTQSTTFKDNAGNALASGKLTVGTTSYTVDSNGVVSIPAQPQGQSMQLSVATVPNNYRFIGWEVNGELICTSTYEYELTADTTVNPIFVPNQVTYDAATGAYQYKDISGNMVDLNGQYVARNADSTVFYTSLQEGFNGDGEVVLLGNMTINGDFEIPENEMLVIPCAMVNVINKDSSGNYIPLANAGGSFSAYATLTMNGNLTVNGALLVSGNQSGSNGAPSGSFGQLTVPAGYTVTVNSGKSLYGYGLVRGAGDILAKNGAMIHELCEVQDFPHPMIMSDLVNKADSYQVMPFNSYYINTIETKTTYEAGANLEGHLAIQYDELTQASFSVIGSSEAILLVKDGTVTKYYDSATGQITFRANEGSNVETGSFTANLDVTFAGISYPAELVSSEYYLPMNCGYQFVVAGNLTMNHNYKMLPGSTVNVLNSGTLTIGENANFVFYRLNDYDYRKNSSSADSGLGFSAKGYPVNMTRYSFNRATIGSAKLNVDGTVIVKGGLYVTEQLIDENSETDSTLSYRNYAHYDNGYNYLTGSGRIDMSAASNSVTKIYENQNNAQSKSSEITEVAIVPLKGLKADATADEATQYESLSGVVKGSTNDNDLNVWSDDPCAEGHSAIKTEIVAVTCVTDGVNAYYTCETCGDHFSDEACTVEIVDLEAWLADDSETGGKIAALGHDYTDVETVYTWSDDYTSCKASRTCKVCGVEDGEPTETVSTTNIGKEVIPATCTTKGTTTYTATFEAPQDAEEGTWVPESNSVDVENIDVDTENGHTYGDPVFVWNDGNTAATASVTCSVCADGTANKTKSLDVTMSESTTDGDCKTNKVTTYTASVEWDGNTVTDSKTVTGELGDHSWKDATCTDARTCTICGATEGEANGHDYTGEVTTAPTCTDAGVKTFTCGTCSDTYTEEVASTGHSYTSVVTAPTCEAQGYTTYTCSCGDTYTGDKVPATGHDMQETTAAVAATCEAAGKTAVYTCANDCGKTEGGEEVAALGHDEVTHEAKAATCTEIGWDAYVTCTRCNYTTYVEKAALGHDEVTHEAKAATCTEIGWDAYVTCSRCDYTTYVEKAALGHKDENPKDHVCDNGCSEYQGTHEAADGKHTCDYCGEAVTTCENSEQTPTYTPADESGKHTVTVTCNVCGAVVSTTTADCADGNGDNMCDACDRELGYAVTITNMTTSAAKATIKVGETEVDGSATIGADGKFTVTCEKACVAIIATDNGDGTKTYKKLDAEATEDADTYAFTVTDMTNGMEVIVAIKADANVDGQFSSADVADLLTNVANSGKIFDDVKTLFFDEITASAAADLLTAIANNKNLEW